MDIYAFFLKKKKHFYMIHIIRINMILAPRKIVTLPHEIGLDQMMGNIICSLRLLNVHNSPSLNERKCEWNGNVFSELQHLLLGLFLVYHTIRLLLWNSQYQSQFIFLTVVKRAAWTFFKTSLFVFHRKKESDTDLERNIWQNFHFCILFSSKYMLIFTYWTIWPCTPFKIFITFNINWTLNHPLRREQVRTTSWECLSLCIWYHTCVDRIRRCENTTQAQQSCSDDNKHTNSRPHINYPAANITHL